MQLGNSALILPSNLNVGRAFLLFALFFAGCASNIQENKSPSPVGTGSLIAQTRILVFHDMGQRGEFWVTCDETLTVPPPGSNRDTFIKAATLRRATWKYWLFKPGEQVPASVFSVEGGGLIDDGGIVSPSTSDQLVDAVMPQDDEIVEVERFAEGTYEVNLWKKQGASGWLLLGPDSVNLNEFDPDKPECKVKISGSTSTGDLQVQLKGPAKTKTFRFRSDEGRWYDVEHPARLPGH